MALDPDIEPAEGTVDRYWWLWGGEAWQQWCERAAPSVTSSATMAP